MILDPFSEGETIILTYDAKGRVIERTIEQHDSSSKTWHFEWNGLDRLTTAYTPEGTKWTYGYDAFARRLYKQEWVKGSKVKNNVITIEWEPGKRHDFLWDGDVIAQETITQKDGNTHNVQWYFEPESFVPIARKENEYLSYVITDHLGTPREVVAEDGTLEWAAQYRTWGRIKNLWQNAKPKKTTPKRGSFQGYSQQGEQVYSTIVNPPRDDNLALKASQNPDSYYCPIRFQGQWEDEETGLYYNRFRYYEAPIGGYLSNDPIGFLGGLQLFAYVATPTNGVDMLGLYGVYVFKVLPGARKNVGRCYVGRGEENRFNKSRKTRSGFNSDKKCAEKHTKGRHYNTDKAADAVGADRTEFGVLVENVLIGDDPQAGFSAKVRPDWINARLDGQKAWNAASNDERNAATQEALRIKELARGNSGCR